MLLGFPGCLRFLALHAYVKNVPVLFVVAGNSDFFFSVYKQGNRTLPTPCSGFTAEVQTNIAMGVAEM